MCSQKNCARAASALACWCRVPWTRRCGTRFLAVRIARMLRPEDVARAAVLIASLPPGATLEELTLLPAAGIL